MKKLLLRCFLLSLPFVLYLARFEIKYSRVPNNQYLVKRNLLEAAEKKIEILILGSSHGYYDILPAVFGGNAFNLAATSQTLYYDTGLLHKYIDQLPHLRIVIFPISYFTLEMELDQSAEPWRCYYYYRFYSIPHRDRRMAQDARNFSLYYLYGRDSGSAGYSIIDSDVSGDYDQWGGFTRETLPTTNDKLKASAVLALLRHNGVMNPADIPINLKLLEKAFVELRERNIRMVLITTPVTSYYRAGMDVRAYSLMQGAVASFCKSHGITYKNYLSDSRFANEDFYDADHLNTRGAQKFSRLLGSEILSATSLKH